MYDKYPSSWILPISASWIPRKFSNNSLIFSSANVRASSTSSTLAGPFALNLNVCLPDPYPCFFPPVPPLRGPMLAKIANKSDNFVSGYQEKSKLLMVSFQTIWAPFLWRSSLSSKKKPWFEKYEKKMPNSWFSGDDMLIKWTARGKNFFPKFL